MSEMILTSSASIDNTEAQHLAETPREVSGSTVSLWEGSDGSATPIAACSTPTGSLNIGSLNDSGIEDTGTVAAKRAREDSDIVVVKESCSTVAADRGEPCEKKQKIDTVVID